MPWWRYPLAVVAVSAVLMLFVVGPRYGVLFSVLGFAAVMALCLVPVVVWRRRNGAAVAGRRDYVAEARPWFILLLVPWVPISFLVVNVAVGGALGIALGAAAACCFVAAVVAVSRGGRPQQRG